MRKAGLLVVVLLALGSAWGEDEANPWAAVFTDGLQNAQGQKVELDQLKGKIVGLYFSAHWCPPCRAFSPRLVEFRDKNADRFEVVFISSDKTAKAKQDYMSALKMKWPSVPWHAVSGKALGEKYKVSGIPALIILSADGKLITTSGRMDVQSDPNTALAKWQAAITK